MVRIATCLDSDEELNLTVAGEEDWIDINEAKEIAVLFGLIKEEEVDDG